MSFGHEKKPISPSCTHGLASFSPWHHFLGPGLRIGHGSTMAPATSARFWRRNRRISDLGLFTGQRPRSRPMKRVKDASFPCFFWPPKSRKTSNLFQHMFCQASVGCSMRCSEQLVCNICVNWFGNQMERRRETTQKPGLRGDLSVKPQ